MSRSDNATPHGAANYDELVRVTIPYYEAIQREAIELVLSVKPDPACWLDTGCGTGYLVEQALPLFPDTQFILADPSEAMLHEARKRLAGPAAGRVTCLPPAGTEDLHLPEPGMRIQVVTALMCHHYLDAAGRERAVRFCSDALEEGGLFIAFENIDFGSEEANRLALDRWNRHQAAHGAAGSDVTEHRARFRTRYFPVRVEDHLRLLRDAGFRTAELFWLSVMQAGFFGIK